MTKEVLGKVGSRQDSGLDNAVRYDKAVKDAWRQVFFSTRSYFLAVITLVAVCIGIYGLSVGLVTGSVLDCIASVLFLAVALGIYSTEIIGAMREVKREQVFIAKCFGISKK